MREQTLSIRCQSEHVAIAINKPFLKLVLQAFNLLTDSSLCQVQHLPGLCHPAGFGNGGKGAKQSNVDIAIHELQEKYSL